MNQPNKQELYTYPEVEVTEVNVRQVICQSNGGTEQYGDGTWNN